MSYVSLGELRSWLSIDDSWDDATLTATKLAAEAGVDSHCGWSFASVSATRKFVVEHSTLLQLGASPLASSQGVSVTVDDDDNGTFELAWSASDFQLEPFNGLGPTGETGWPFTRIRAVGGAEFPFSDYKRPTVEVHGTFGWPSVPEAVKQATLIAAAWLWANKASPTGVQMTEFGPMSIRQMPQAERLLAPYRRGGVIAAIGGWI